MKRILIIAALLIISGCSAEPEWILIKSSDGCYGVTKWTGADYQCRTKEEAEVLLKSLNRKWQPVNPS